MYQAKKDPDEVLQARRRMIAALVRFFMLVF